MTSPIQSKFAETNEQHNAPLQNPNNLSEFHSNLHRG
jgi:hypothetical protein